MEPEQIIDTLKAELMNMKSKGNKTVSIDSLDNYLDGLRANAGQSIELHKLEFQRSIAHYDALNKRDAEMFKSVIDSGREALNALVLINGGAVIALLGFMGATISKGLPAVLGANLSIPLLLFGLGVLAGALGFGARYCAQAFYCENKTKLGNSFNYSSISLAIIGYSLFGFSIYKAFRAFVTQFQLFSL